MENPFEKKLTPDLSKDETREKKVVPIDEEEIKYIYAHLLSKSIVGICKSLENNILENKNISEQGFFFDKEEIILVCSGNETGEEFSIGFEIKGKKSEFNSLFENALKEKINELDFGKKYNIVRWVRDIKIDEDEEKAYSNPKISTQEMVVSKGKPLQNVKK